MGKRGVRFIVCSALLFAALIVCFLCFVFDVNNAVLSDFEVIDATEWETIVSSYTEISVDRTALTFNGGQVAYDASSNTFYIPQNMESAKWTGICNISNADRIVVLEDMYLNDKSGALETGHAFSCLYLSGSVYGHFYIVLTGLPTISITYSQDEEIVEKEDHNGTIVVQETNGTYQVSDCVFHARGQASYYYSVKKSYKISLTSGEEKNHLSLCGMRTDDDWILNSLNVDPTRIRETLAYWTWETMQTMTGYSSSAPGMEFVEVFFNDEYYGLYALMEPIDGKTFDLNKGDLLYQIYTENILEEENEAVNLTSFNGEEALYGAEISWPKAGSGNGDLSWDILQYIHNYGEGYTSWAELLREGVILQVGNFALYDVFINLIDAYDNVSNNHYLKCEIQMDGTYVVEQVPWDLNYCLGCTWDGTMNEYAASTDLSHNYLWMAYMSEFPEEADDMTRTIWHNLRDAGFSAELICDKAEELMGNLTGSGALARERERWNDFDYEANGYISADMFDCSVNENDYPLLIEWIKTRFDVFDVFYGYEG